MAKQRFVPWLEKELICPICLKIYSSPVSLSCGHTFCNECTQKACSNQNRFSCPLCCAQADPSTELEPNDLLCNRLLDAPAHQEEENHEAQCEEKGESSGQQDKVILCDFCLQEPQPAVKTCLNCEASLCQAHVSKHCTEGLLKDHVLSEPCDAWFLSKRCPRHGTVLESFCKTDSIWVCMLCCVTGSHKNHEVATLEEAFGEAQTKETLWRNRLKSLFEEMRLQLDNKKEDVMEALDRNEKQQLSVIQMQIDKLKEGKDAVSHDVRELKALRDQKDPLLFTKAFAATQAR
ncbi:PREDICTED: probable E3 ubiquitin-protein ligase TRIM8 [Chlamydotis macqueenii]|uniref:probable E3 ubiquitin-protein ligase TRIM8 n=1 Tax=Chlamydotis macqueenii TaxID=187382 RepID=UPI000529B469|nr:PREDICTED: probable E3 ubiquitin-protein ligase TRIM8 [Chlamydotis macqueenii]